ncbi:MAG: hypothetical protein BroJett040_09870 [Oligoflexia bacterium]|nr:MAG: hypothetical protein BroJett040_09870 [Oligoflexia bacterium]
MQIDFHLGVTYILCRMAGFDSREANIIAGSSQFVDDAVHSGVLYFDNDYLYEFIASAHRHLDYRNFQELANHRVWIPFHFLPSGESTSPLICRPNSIIAQHMLREMTPYLRQPIGLYLLGVTLHAYADTWAHQGFSGTTSDRNVAIEIYDEVGNIDAEKMKHRKKYFEEQNPWWKKLWNKIFAYFLSQGVSEINPIGHGPVLSYPDQAFLRWGYKDWQGNVIFRDNPSEYFEAAEHILGFLIQLRQEHGLPVAKISDEDKQKIKTLLREIQHVDGLERLQLWRSAIQSGGFSFGKDPWTYSCDGSSCWTRECFGITDDGDFSFADLAYTDEFLSSHWKLSHDALIFHRFKIVHQILPQYKLCIS